MLFSRPHHNRDELKLNLCMVSCVQWTDNPVALLSLFLFVYQNSHISQAFQFFVPIGAGAGLHLPSSMFIGQTSDKRASPDLSADEQLACRWKKVRPRK